MDYNFFFLFIGGHRSFCETVRLGSNMLQTEGRLTFSEMVGPQEALCLHRNASWRTCPEPGQHCIPTEKLGKSTCEQPTFKGPVHRIQVTLGAEMEYNVHNYVFISV